MKITFAEFYNFKHLYSALDKYKVTLDFSNMPNVINVIIGKMGSGKTTILSHLQPWSSFGTLDERNTDGIIIDGKNGYKKLTIMDGSVEYQIDHEWTWSKDHHSLKSYITKDGKELNPNGNQSSFKELVEIEFGVDQNFLRLARLGPNVSNIIEMTSAERKDFIAERLSDVDLYLTIYKDMTERSRAITAQTHILSKKLQNVTDESISEAHEMLDKMKLKEEDLKALIDISTSKFHKLIGENHVYLDGLSANEYYAQIEAQIRYSTQLNEQCIDIESKLREIRAEGSTEQIVKRIGEVEALLNVKTNDIQSLNKKYDELMVRKNQLIKTKSASVNSEYLASLSKQYMEQVTMVEELEKELYGFECPYNSVELKKLIAEVQAFDMSLSDIFDYNRESVITCFKSYEKETRASITSSIERLRLRKLKLQKELNNVQYINNYEVDEALTAPNCGQHKNCPYYRTHPAIMYKGIIPSEKQTEIMAEMEGIDVRIDTLSEYPIIVKKLGKLKQDFADLVGKLKPLGVIRVNSLKTIISSSNSRVWYNSDSLVSIMEKVTRQESMYSMKVSLPGLKSEIDKYSDINVGDIEVQLSELNDLLDKVKASIISIEDETTKYKTEVKHLYELHDEFLHAEALSKEYDERISDKNKVDERVNVMKSNYQLAAKNAEEINSLKTTISNTNTELQSVMNDINALNNKLRDIEAAKEEFGHLLHQQNVINLIKEASSSKKGIPLVYVKLFLDDCVDIINELISMVFDDTIEIKEFNITEKEFFIPYYKNGIEISDVKTASQGERSIISLALSFALMRKSLTNYNILLLDEIDGALYSSDREKFLMILAQQIQAINAEQVFLITHNNIISGGYPINLILTTPEHVDKSNIPTIYA